MRAAITYSGPAPVCVVYSLPNPEKAKFVAELEATRAAFAAFCDEQGYKDRADPAERVIDLAAAFMALGQTEAAL